MPTDSIETNGVRVGMTVPGPYVTFDGEKKEHRDFAISINIGGNYMRMTGLQAATLYHAFQDPKVREFINMLVAREKENLPDGI